MQRIKAVHVLPCMVTRFTIEQSPESRIGELYMNFGRAPNRQL